MKLAIILAATIVAVSINVSTVLEHCWFIAFLLVVFAIWDVCDSVKIKTNITVKDKNGNIVGSIESK